MTSAWILHVKKFALDNNLKYGDAMKLAKATYVSPKKGGSLTAGETQDLIKSSYSTDDVDIGNLKIDKELSGKRTKVYYDEENNKPIIVHRGTASIQDVGTDIGLAFGHRGKRFQHAEKMQRKAEKKYGTENMHTLGHSLGGLVAEEVSRKGSNTITLNKAVTPWELGRRNKNQHDIKTSNDPVSMLNAFANPKNKTTVMKSKTWNPLKEHSSDSMKNMKRFKKLGK